MPIVEIVYKDPNLDADEFECDFVKSTDSQLFLIDVNHPFVATKVGLAWSDIKYYIESEDEVDGEEDPAL